MNLPFAGLFRRERSTQGGVPTFSTVLWLAAGMACATAPFIGRVPWWLLTFAAVIAAWRLRLAWFARPAPSRGVRHLLSLGVLGVLWTTGNVGFGLDAASPLFVAFLWIKLLELDAERDVLMAAFLGFFLVTGVLLAGQSMLLTLQALLAAMIILGGVLWYHSPHLGGAAAVDGSTVSPAALGLRATVPPRAVLATLGKVLLLIGQSLPFAIVLFLFVPRPVIQLSLNSRNAQSGISDHMDPGRFAANTRNEQVAFRVEFPDGDMPFIDDLYWRGVVLWQTDGNAWTRGPEMQRPSAVGWVTRRMPETAASGRSGRDTDRTVLQDITLPGNQNPWIYALDTPDGQVAGAFIYPGLVMEWRDGPTGTTTYRARGNPALRPADWGMIARRYGLQLPRGLDPRISALATELRNGAGTADEVIDRGVDWIARNGFVYTLEPGEMGPNATATFLFEKRRGFCGHYAGAFAVLMRAAGIPARVVLGYRGGEVNEHGGFLVVRQSQAHAWTEVWTGSDTTGWRRVDLTGVIPVEDPATGRPTTQPAAQAIGATARAAQRAGRPWYDQALFRARLWYEYVESRWDRWAVGYNSELQAELLAWLGLDDFGDLGNGIGLVLGGMAVVIVIVLSGWLAPRLRLMLSRSAEERLYGRLLARSAAAGLPRLPHEGPRDHAARVCARHPDQAEAIRAGVEAWLRLRFGGGSDPADVATLGRAAEAARRLTR